MKMSEMVIVNCKIKKRRYINFYQEIIFSNRINMPGTYENNIFDDNYEFTTPVTRLKEGLPISELLKKCQSEFEVSPEEEDDGYTEGTSAESCFDFDDLAKVANLDLIDIGQDQGEDDGSPFDRYRRKMEDLREDGKLKKYVLKPGIGPLVPENSIVYIRYQAHLEYAELPFDSTLWQCDGRGDLPVPMNLAKGQLLPGLHLSLLSMKKGEKAEFLIHPDLAYGPLGCAPRVPPDATVLFIVEVDRFLDCGDAFINNDDDLSNEERSQFCNVFKIAKSNYVLANDLFTKENFGSAVNKYRQVINMMHNARLANEEEENERNHFLVKMYTNACVCYHKLKNYKRVCIMAADAMRVNQPEASKNYKLLYFWGYAKMMLNDYNAAKKHLLTAKTLKPLDKDIGNALKELDKKKNYHLQQEKLMSRKAFGFAPSQVKITEVDEAEEDFRNKIAEQLKEFMENPNRDSMVLRDNFTCDEEKICIQLAKGMGLYARVIDGNTRIIQIKKPADM